MESRNQRRGIVLSFAVVIAGLSLAVSLLSLFLSWLAYKRAGPRISVNIWKHAFSSGHRVFIVVVQNRGAGEITLHDVGLVAEGSTSARISAPRLRQAGSEAKGPILPHRLRGRDSAEWDFQGTWATDTFGGTTKVYGYAEIVPGLRSRWRKGSKATGEYAVIMSERSEFNEGLPTG
jgi:hypothetical protein